MTTKTRSAARDALEIYATHGRPIRRPYSQPHSLLIDQALTFEEAAADAGDMLAFIRHQDVRHSVEASAFDGPDGSA